MSEKLVTLGDILKSESDPQSRDFVVADNVKIGQIVEYRLKTGGSARKLVALSDSEHGKVLVQPYNCVIDLSYTHEESITAAKMTLTTLAGNGAQFGIKYIGTPIAAPQSVEASGTPANSGGD